MDRVQPILFGVWLHGYW